MGYMRRRWSHTLGARLQAAYLPHQHFGETTCPPHAQAGLRTAQRRVAMASLYLGTGEGREAEIAAALAAAAHDGCRPSLRIHLLLDALRCTRATCGYGRASTSSSSSVDSSSSSSGGGASVESSSSGGGGGGDSSGGSGAAQPPPMTSTAEMLATQLLEGQAGEGRVAVSLFHTPALRGLLKRWVRGAGAGRVQGFAVACWSASAYINPIYSTRSLPPVSQPTHLPAPALQHAAAARVGGAWSDAHEGLCV